MPTVLLQHGTRRPYTAGAPKAVMLEQLRWFVNEVTQRFKNGQPHDR